MQRQLAIQRLQEQEKERQMRLEQQKHTVQMRAQMPAFSLPYAQVNTELAALTDLERSGPWRLTFSCSAADAIFTPECRGRLGLPARGPAQLPRHFQPCWFCRGFTHAQHLYESGRAGWTGSVPGHAPLCDRWGSTMGRTNCLVPVHWCMCLTFSRSKYGECLHVPGCGHQRATSPSRRSSPSRYHSCLLELSAHTGLPGMAVRHA